MQQELKINQTVYLIGPGNITLNGTYACKDVIKSIGRLYYITESGKKFDKKTMRYIDNGSNNDYILYTSEDEMNNELLRRKLYPIVQRKIFNVGAFRYSASQLQEFCRIADLDISHIN